MKLLAFAASSSRNSINKQLATHAANVYKTEFDQDADIEILHLNDYEMTISSIDRENENGIPELAHTFYNKIGEADLLVISYAEHNGSYSAAYKNIFDWMSRIDMKVFQNKKMLIMASSVGGHGGANILKTAVESAPHFTADVISSFAVGPFAEKFDSEVGQFIDPELAKKLRLALDNVG